MTDILDSSAPGLEWKKLIVEGNTPIALVCYESALQLPTSPPSMHNQLSNLTYSRKACEAHGTGRAVIQKVPIYRNFLQDRFRVSGFLLCSTTDWQVVCMLNSAPTRLLPGPTEFQFEAPWAHAYTHLYTCWYTFVPHTHTKGKQRDQREIKWPARVLMREGWASGIYLKPFLPPPALSGGL